MIIFLKTKVEISDIPGIAPIRIVFRDLGCRKNRIHAIAEMIPSAKRLSGLKVAANAATETATAISMEDHVENESSRYAKAIITTIAAERSGLGDETYSHGSLAAIERITGVARMSKILPGVVLVLRQRRSRDEHSKMRKRSTKPFAKRKPFTDQRPPSKNAPRLYVVEANPNLE
jgi:hypothetical protein